MIMNSLHDATIVQVNQTIKTRSIFGHTTWYKHVLMQIISIFSVMTSLCNISSHNSFLYILSKDLFILFSLYVIINLNIKYYTSKANREILLGILEEVKDGGGKQTNKRSNVKFDYN